MEMTFDREKRREQREVLKMVFKHYLPLHHDAFVEEYNRIVDAKKLDEYMKNRGIK
jgi:hypothetical protein